jgi:hypothetical protein
MNTNITPSEYYDHPYNDTLHCERAVELPLAFNYLDWVSKQGRMACEIGAVTPYYRPAGYDVIDPCDQYGTIKLTAEDYCFKNRDVLSISTIEHFGFGDYGLPLDPPLAFNQLKRIFDECLSCFITWPIGYNKFFDKQVQLAQSFKYFFYVKTSDNPLNWMFSYHNDCFFDYTYGPRGNCIICVHKGVTFTGEQDECKTMAAKI